MSDFKTLVIITFLLFCTLCALIITLRVSDYKVQMLNNDIKNAKQYCIGKENRIKFCYDLMSKR